MNLTEEMQIYLEVSRGCKKSFAEQMRIAEARGQLVNETALKRQISGDVTERTIRDHLMKHKIKVSKTQVFIEGATDPIDLLSLREIADVSKEKFNSEEVDTVIEITNTGVSDKSTRVNRKFDKIKNTSGSLNFAVIVLSERVDYPNAVVREKLKKDFNCEVYTLLLRDRYINPFDWSELRILEEYHRKTDGDDSAIMETGDWQEVLNLLQHVHTSNNG
jgi:hypothetical protein